MNGINERWQRDNRFVRILTGYGMVLSVALWPISYYASFPAAKNGQGIWFAALSAVTLVAAIGISIAWVIGLSHIVTDEAPKPGDNRP